MRLVVAMAQVNFCLSRPGVLAVWQTAREEEPAIRLDGVEAAGPEPCAHDLLVAQVPVARRGSVLRSRHIGRHTLSVLTGYQTYLYAPLLRDEGPQHDEILDCLARQLRQARPRWAFLEFSPMDAEAPSYGALAAAPIGRANV